MKWFALIGLLLFIGVAVAPSINADVKELSFSHTSPLFRARTGRALKQDNYKNYNSNYLGDKDNISLPIFSRDISANLDSDMFKFLKIIKSNPKLLDRIKKFNFKEYDFKLLSINNSINNVSRFNGLFKDLGFNAPVGEPTYEGTCMIPICITSFEPFCSILLLLAFIFSCATFILLPLFKLYELLGTLFWIIFYWVTTYTADFGYCPPIENTKNIYSEIKEGKIA